MVERPGEEESAPPGGHAAERLREFIDQRFPEGVDPSEAPADPLAEEPPPEPEPEPGDDTPHDESATGDSSMPAD